MSGDVGEGQQWLWWMGWVIALLWSCGWWNSWVWEGVSSLSLSLSWWNGWVWGGVIVIVIVDTDGLLLSRIECSGSCVGCCREQWWWCSGNNLAIHCQSLILNLYYKTWSIKWLNRGRWCQCVGYIIQYILHYMEVKATQVLCKLVFYQTSSPMDR